jgi:hypothetical protein
MAKIILIPSDLNMNSLKALVGAVFLSVLPLTDLSAQAPPQAAKLLAADHAAVKAAAGAWDAELANGRKCRIQLNPKGTRDAPVIGMPTPCRMSMPMLATAAVWGLDTEGRIQFSAADGKLIALFGREGAGAASGPLRAQVGAEAVTLTPASGRYPDPVRQVAQVAATTPPRAASITPGTPAPPVDQLPGTYAVMRQPGREVCRLTLDARAAVKPDQKQARFAGTCGDTGFATFDPVAWRFGDGRLSLVARKGHEITLAYGADGTWQKDPPSGAALLLRRAAP